MNQQQLATPAKYISTSEVRSHFYLSPRLTNCHALLLDSQIQELIMGPRGRSPISAHFEAMILGRSGVHEKPTVCPTCWLGIETAILE